MNAEIILKILDYTSAYVVVLDSEMKIRYINLALANKLGFENAQELMNRCWLDFIDVQIQDKIKTVHRTLLTSFQSEYNEFINEVIDRHGNPTTIKWLNTSINSETNWTFSMGVPERVDLANFTGDDIRQQFKAAIESDRTMIRSLKECINGCEGIDDTCEMTEE